GDFLLDPVVPYDTAFHVGLARELTLGYPPQIPGVSGFPIGYHFGIDLLRAAALRWAGLDPFDAIARFDATLGALALVLALRAITHRLGASPAAVSLAPWTLLLTDSSFVFAPNPQAHWWADLLRGNLLVSLAVANPIVPALAMALGALCAFSRYQAGEGRGHLALPAGLAFAVPFLKAVPRAPLRLRLVGLPAAWQALRSGADGAVGAVGAVLAAMSLSAWPLGLFFRVSAPEVLPGQTTVNDAAYLVEQGGPLLWIFTVIALAAFA